MDFGLQFSDQFVLGCGPSGLSLRLGRNIILYNPAGLYIYKNKIDKLKIYKTQS